jgi:hypothetical protein
MTDDNAPTLGIDWTEPVPLDAATRGARIPAVPGLYRIRRLNQEHWDYIGQTGAGTMNLRKRMTMLKGIYGELMPYRDPHTAGPALWALRQLDERPLEVAFCPVNGPTPWRKGLEALAIALHRQRYGRSPTVNFGRMPYGYRMSSGNNARLVATGKRFRGGSVTVDEDAHRPGIPPLAPLTGEVDSDTWGGHRWSSWTRAMPPAFRAGNGLYRIRGDASGLVYIGEGVVSQRLRAHLAKVTTGSAQGNVLAASAPLAFSWSLNEDWLRHQRLELETDLIAAHVLALHAVPTAQFIG